MPYSSGPVFIGIDGGATGTRLRLAAADGTVLGEGSAGPSSLTLPLADSLAAVGIALDAALSAAGLTRDVLGEAIAAFGLAGARNPERRDAFLARLPAMRDVTVVGDGYAALIGAHTGEPGLVVAIGTGTVAHVLRPDGSSDQVGGWGFPIGDEGSGAWIGWRALAEAVHVRDGRFCDPPGGTALHRELLSLCGDSDAGILAWLQEARSTKYAGLAPVVL
ncbi:MAG: BadF/BadG/BcrA/BcrD ATPase family protein, partial [Azospirillaceae bacterium]